MPFRDPHAAILRGIDRLADAARVTLGPKGRNVIIEKKYGSPTITRDGLTVAREIELADPFESLGEQMVREVASKTFDAAGDGATTATVLAQAIYREGSKRITAGADPWEIKRGIDMAVKAAVESIDRLSRPVEGKDIAHIGAISADNDEEIGRLISEAMAEAGRDGVITVEEAPGPESTVELARGLQLDRGYLSPYFTTDPERMEAVLENAKILLLETRISSMKDLLPVLEQVARQGRSLLIVAEDVEGEALATLVVNKLRGTLRVAAVKAPGFGQHRRELLEHVGALTGGRVVSGLEDVRWDDLGNARKVVITKQDTTIVTARPSDWMGSRILGSGAAVIRVGAATETEMKERKARVEDAVHATRAAVEEGVVPGGGVALLRAAKAVGSLPAEGDVKMGVNIVRRALAEPARQIAVNAGEKGSVVVRRILSRKENSGFNAVTGKFEDLVLAGVVDPAKVTKTALVNAASIAGLLLTTDAMLGGSLSDEYLGYSIESGDPETEAPPIAPIAPLEYRERRAQAQLFNLGGADPVKVDQAPLLPGRYRLEVWIGPEMAGALVAPEPFPELPPTPHGHQLTVVLTAPALGGEPQTRTLHLPPAGPSETVPFDLEIGGNVRRLDARITILHENRIVQTLLLLASVGRGKTERLALGIENVVRRDLNSVVGRQRFDAALILNRLGPSRTVTLFKDDHASLIPVDGEIEKFTREVSSALAAASNSPKKYGKPATAGTTALLAGLARRGVLLRDALLELPHVREDLAQARRIQILSAKPHEPTLPLEICYDGAAPGKGARMCPQWEAALESGMCQPACPADRGTVVCPVAFWGTSRIIERHAYAKVDAKHLDGNNFALQSEPLDGRTRLNVAPGSVCAAAKAARAVDAKAVDQAFAKAGTIAQPTGEVSDWKAWKTAILRNPSLLVLLAHTDQEDGTRTLVIGSEDATFMTSIDSSFIGSAAGHGPIVLLLGCSTAIPELAFQSFVARFRLAGAAIVIGTLCEILGQHAAPIASQILEELGHASNTRDGIPLGDLMTVLRRRLLAQGYPIVLAIAAFGDADWLV